MYAIQPPSKPSKVTPNILPCRIAHNGPLSTTKRHWNPTTTTSHHQTAYFRGRKLLGTNVKLPASYEGVVLQKTDKKLPVANKPEEEEEEDEDVEVRIMEMQGTFDEVVVWGHEEVPDEGDVYRKGIEEWIGFAEAMHAYDQKT